MNIEKYLRKNWVNTDFEITKIKRTFKEKPIKKLIFWDKFFFFSDYFFTNFDNNLWWTDKKNELQKQIWNSQ